MNTIEEDTEHGAEPAVSTQHTNETELPRLLTYAQVAARTGLPVGTVYDLVHRGAIPHVRLGPRLVRFPEHELRAWLQERMVSPPSGRAK